MICHVYALSTVTITNDKSVEPSVQVKPVTVQFVEYSSLCHTCAVICDTCYTGKNPPKNGRNSVSNSLLTICPDMPSIRYGLMTNCKQLRAFTKYHATDI